MLGKDECGNCGEPLKDRPIHVSVTVWKGEGREDEKHFCDQVCLAHGMIDFLDMMLEEAYAQLAK